MTTEKKIPPAVPIRVISLDLLIAAEWNPTEENKRNIDLLVNNIRQFGFLVNPTVISLDDSHYRILAGHDRVIAARIAGLKEVPCAVLPKETSEEMQKLLTVRLNVIQKGLDPAKLFKLHQELAEKYGEDVAQAMMMATDQEVLARKIDIARKAISGISGSMRKELDKKAAGVKTVEDLQSVISEIMSRAGTQLDRGFLVFSQGGVDHIYVAMDKPLHEKMKQFMAKSELENRHISEIFKEALGVT